MCFSHGAKIYGMKKRERNNPDVMDFECRRCICSVTRMDRVRKEEIAEEFLRVKDE